MPGPAQALENLLAAAERGEGADVGSLVEPLSEPDLDSLEQAVRRELGALPVPIGRQVDDPPARKRRVLDRVLAWIRAKRGDPSDLLALAREDWLAGGRHADYLRLLMEYGRPADAIAMARTLLQHGHTHHRSELEGLMEEAARPPEGWADAVRQFARAPSQEGWKRLIRFIPQDRYEERVRYTLALLQSLEVQGDVLFRCATYEGVTAEAIELVEKGQVDPRVVEERAERSTKEGRPLWLGLASRAACVRGDAFSTVRLLRQACAYPDTGGAVTRDIAFVRARAGEQMRELLDRAGIPRS
jgi:hypothetical protein